LCDSLLQLQLQTLWDWNHYL